MADTKGNSDTLNGFEKAVVEITGDVVGPKSAAATVRAYDEINKGNVGAYLIDSAKTFGAEVADIAANVKHLVTGGNDVSEAPKPAAQAVAVDKGTQQR